MKIRFSLNKLKHIDREPDTGLKTFLLKNLVRQKVFFGLQQKGSGIMEERINNLRQEINIKINELFDKISKSEARKTEHLMTIQQNEDSTTQRPSASVCNLHGFFRIMRCGRKTIVSYNNKNNKKASHLKISRSQTYDI